LGGAAAGGVTAGRGRRGQGGEEGFGLGFGIWSWLAGLEGWPGRPPDRRWSWVEGGDGTAGWVVEDGGAGGGGI